MKTESFHRIQKRRFSKPWLIVGIDPRTRTAYATFDLNEIVITTRSKKEVDLSSLITEIIKLAKPIFCLI